MTGKSLLLVCTCLRIKCLVCCGGFFFFFPLPDGWFFGSLLTFALLSSACYQTAETRVSYHF